MTVSRRGLRRLVVGGVEYQWRIRRKPTYVEANAWRGMTVTIQRAGGSVLTVILRDAHPGNWMAAPSRAVLPSDVERFIRDALARGWRSSEAGAPFTLEIP